MYVYLLSMIKGEDEFKRNELWHLQFVHRSVGRTSMKVFCLSAYCTFMLSSLYFENDRPKKGNNEVSTTTPVRETTVELLFYNAEINKVINRDGKHRLRPSFSQTFVPGKVR